MALTTNYKAVKSPYAGGYSSPSRPGSINDIVDKLPSLSINIDKIFKLNPEDKVQVWKMIDDVLGIYSKGEREGYSSGELLKLKLIYNTLYNSDYLCTKRDKNLANLLDGEEKN